MSTDPASGPQLCVLVRTLEQTRAVLQWQQGRGELPAMLYGDYVETEHAAEALGMAAVAGTKMALVTPVITEPGEENLLDALAGLEPAAILVRNLTGLVYLQERWPTVPLIGDYALNVANELAADALTRAGLVRLTASYDLNIGQLRTMLTRLPGIPVEVIVHAHVPMFHMAFCVAGRWLAHAGDCSHCSHPCRQHNLQLVDPQGREHSLLTVSGGRTAVFGGTAQSILIAAGGDDAVRNTISHARIEFLDEQPGEVTAVLDSWRSFLDGSLDACEAVKMLGAVYPAGVVAGTFGFE